MTRGEVRSSDVSIFLNTVTVKQSLYRPGQAISARWFRYPEFLDNQHIKVVYYAHFFPCWLYTVEAAYYDHFGTGVF